MDKALVIKEKRPFEKGEVDDDNDATLPEKRPKISRFDSGFMEAWLMKALKEGPVKLQFCEMIEPLLRKVVREETENTLSRFVSSNGLICIPRQIKCAAGSRTLCLHFKSKLPASIFTLAKVRDYQGLPVCIELQDRATGEVVTKGQESVAKLEVVALTGDFSGDDSEYWYQEDLVKERKGKPPLLSGNLTITLKEGVGTLGDVTFTDNSSWTKSKTFRLGVRLNAEFSECLSVREGKSGAFKVKERRGECYEKHYPPAPNDDVWRLENIYKDGTYHKKLKDKGIQTVEQFYRSFTRDPQKLRSILGPRISNKELQDMVAHAQMCNFSDKVDEFTSVELLTDNNKLVKEMYETGSKIDSGKMFISGERDKLGGAGSHGKESGAAMQHYNGNPATCTRHAIQDQQSGQHLPFIPWQLPLNEAVTCGPMFCSHEGFDVSASVEASKCIRYDFPSSLFPQTSPRGLSDTMICAPSYLTDEGFVVSASVEASKSVTSPYYDFSPPFPQTSPGGLKELPTFFDEILPYNTEQNEIGDNQELPQMLNPCIPGTLNVTGEAVSVLCQSFVLSSADTAGMYKGGSLSNSCSRLRTAIAVVGVMLRIRDYVEETRKENQ